MKLFDKFSLTLFGVILLVVGAVFAGPTSTITDEQLGSLAIQAVEGFGATVALPDGESIASVGSELKGLSGLQTQGTLWDKLMVIFGFVFAWVGRVRQGDVSLLGTKKREDTIVTRRPPGSGHVVGGLALLMMLLGACGPTGPFIDSGHFSIVENPDGSVCVRMVDAYDGQVAATDCITNPEDPNVRLTREHFAKLCAVSDLCTLKGADGE